MIKKLEEKNAYSAIFKRPLLQAFVFADPSLHLKSFKCLKSLKRKKNLNPSFLYVSFMEFKK